MPSPPNFLARIAREPLSPLRGAIRHWVLHAFPRADSGSLDYDHPHGDPGLFGPDSATWRVHSDSPACWLAAWRR